MFAKVMSVVLGFLGISAFAKDEHGKSVLLSGQEEQLKNKYGEKFVAEFKKDLADFEKDGAAAESAVTAEVQTALEAERSQYAKELTDARQRLADLDKQVKEMKEAIASKDAAIDKMAKEPADDNGQTVNQQGGEQMARFKPDMSMAHNQMIDAAFKGEIGRAHV